MSATGKSTVPAHSPAPPSGPTAADAAPHSRPWAASCPIALRDYPQVLLAHGGGGKLMHDLIEKLIVPAFSNRPLAVRHDASVFDAGGQRLAFTTDSYVVRPLFFPGGDIGSLAVHGTVNDLAMAGARARFLSAAFIIEEGLPMDVLGRIVGSMQNAARTCGVEIITGDTKVVDKGKGDGLFVNTSGVGVIERPLFIHPGAVQPGDAILLSGDIGRHGMAILAVREGLGFESQIESDCAPLLEPVMRLLGAEITLHCLRDLTRGGLASALNEIAEAANRPMQVEHRAVPVRPDVKAACEILGLDPMLVACEGRFVAFVPHEQAEPALKLLRELPLTTNACRIGTVLDTPGHRVLLRSLAGVNRVLDMPAGEQLPRIC